MPSEKEKMLSGEFYDPLDAELSLLRKKARHLFKIINNPQSSEEEAASAIKILFGFCKELPWIEPPFYCDYGINISLGEKVFFNFNCVVLDVNRVTIGDNVLFAPNVQIYTATHPFDSEVRKKGLELGLPITIGSDVWVGGSAIICPGVTIGSRTVIGAGSVVTRDIPDDVLAAGNPCRVIKNFTAA